MATILLVDDDRSFGAALERLLRRDGHRTRLAPDCATALQEAAQERSEVELVIADVHLFRESGLDLLGELRRQKPSLPVILLSASPDAASYLDALRLGAYEFLAKPVDFAELRQVVQRALTSSREAA